MPVVAPEKVTLSLNDVIALALLPLIEDVDETMLPVFNATLPDAEDIPEEIDWLSCNGFDPSKLAFGLPRASKVTRTSARDEAIDAVESSKTAAVREKVSISVSPED
jgi:hypothetical protein